MRAAILDSNNVVINVAQSAPDFASDQGWIISDTARLGDSYDARTGTFTVPKRALDELKHAKHSEIDQHRDDAFAAGLHYEINGQPDVVQTSMADKVNLLGLRIEAQELKAGGVADAVMPFRAESNASYTLTPTQMIDLTNAALAHIQSIYQQSWQLKDAVETAATRDEVEAVVWP